MKFTRYFRQVLICTTFVSIFLLIGCAKEEDEVKVEPTLTSLWDNVFSGCGVSCHSVNATFGEENGPIFDSKENFYNSLVNKTASTDYPLWVKTGDCDNINFISPNDATQSTLAAALVSSISESLGLTCETTYGFHDRNNSVISDSDTAAALIKWIDDGAANN